MTLSSEQISILNEYFMSRVLTVVEIGTSADPACKLVPTTSPLLQHITVAPFQIGSDFKPKNTELFPTLEVYAAGLKEVITSYISVGMDLIGLVESLIVKNEPCLEFHTTMGSCIGKYCTKSHAPVTPSSTKYLLYQCNM